MKKEYLKPEVELSFFEGQDIVCASGDEFHNQEAKKDETWEELL